MKSIIKTMKDKLGITIDTISFYEGGVSNDNFLINNKYIYRRKKSFSQPFYDAKCEKEIELFFKNKDFTIDLIDIYDDGTKITKFIKNAQDLSKVELTDELLINIAKKLRELHNFKFKASKDFDPISRLHYYLESNRNPQKKLNRYIIDKIHKYYNNCDLIMCHNDLVPGNILIFNDNSIKFIDFEYAQNNHPFFDVISFLSENNITDQRQIDLFISTYYENKLPENIKEMTEDFFNFLDLLWYNWAVMMHANLHEPIYYLIAKSKSSRLKQIKIKE